MDFAKATRETGVNGEMTFNTPGVYMKPGDLVPFDDEACWYQCLEAAQTVKLARGEVSMAEVNNELKNFIGLGETFQTEAFKHIGIETVRDGALFVQMDDPWELFAYLDDYLRTEKKLTPTFNFQPKRGVNFIGAGRNIWRKAATHAVFEVLYQAFAYKWDLMVARPEERVAAVLKGEVEAPRWFDSEIRQYVFEDKVIRDPRSFTIYKEGCPTHPSYPAGHGTVAGATYALLWIMYGLNGKSALNEDIGQSCLSFAHCRTLAGVHYSQDNSEGFKLGVKAIQQNIANIMHLAGAPKDEVTRIAEYARDLNVDWVK